VHTTRLKYYCNAIIPY